MSAPVAGRPWCPAPARTGDGEPVRVLLLHGLGGRPEAWTDLVDRLPARPGRPVEPWLVELPWHGRADSAWSHHGDQVEVLVRLLRPGFDAVVAHSFAANLLVQAYALGRLEPRPSVLVSPFHRSSPADFDWATISYYLNDFHRTFREAIDLADTARYSPRRRDWLARGLRDRVGPYGWLRFFEAYLRSPLLDLDAVRAPVLVLTGEADIAARPTDGRALAEALPDGRFEQLAGCGHFPMLEQPDRVARLVLEFFSATAHEPCLELT